MTGKRIFIFVSALALLLSTIGGAAEGAPKAQRTKTRKEKLFHKNVIAPVLRSAKQHGPNTDHLPATRNDVQLVGKLRLTGIVNGVSDVHYFRNHAYVGGWAGQCRFDTQGNAVRGGGTYVVNVSNPARPRRVAFITAGPNNYVTEGVHALHVDTQFFTGDLLIISNEACDSLQPHRGGIDIFDITNPARPVALARGAGDRDYEVPGMGPEANQSHSAMGWFDRANGSAYAVLVDNEEIADVDILDITDPQTPFLISETDPREWPSCTVTAGVEPCFTVDAHGGEPTHHDMWVQKIGGTWHLMLSYWDGGWVDLNVDNPVVPVFIQDTDYADPDPEFPSASPPEGNAHQGEWTRNRQFFIGTDEDFSAERFETFQVTTWPVPADRERGAGVFGFTPPVSQVFPADQQVNGPVVWGGSGCEEDLDGDGTSDRTEAINAAGKNVVFPGGAGLDPGEEPTIVFTRGVCFFSIKIETGQMAGYDVVIIGNHHVGASGGTTPDAFTCGSQGHQYQKTATGFCVGHRTMHDFFNDPPTYTPSDSNVAPGPPRVYPGVDLADVPLGRIGHEIFGQVTFDGFGYVHSFDADTYQELDTFAPTVVKKPENSFGKGDMSVHEVEADPRRGKRLVYASWYAAGLRVMAYDAAGNLRQVGRFIDRGGNQFWGVAVEPRGRARPLIYMSDMDSGLYILKYTGRE
jgi:hypothetical protein